MSSQLSRTKFSLTHDPADNVRFAGEVRGVLQHLNCTQGELALLLSKTPNQIHAWVHGLVKGPPLPWRVIRALALVPKERADEDEWVSAVVNGEAEQAFYYLLGLVDSPTARQPES